MHYEGEEADGLLSAWTSLWHPILLATTGAAPTWCRSDSGPEDFFDRLIVVPGVSERELPAGYIERAEAEGGHAIVGDLPRETILARALAPLDRSADQLDPDLEADFLALGYCFLQVELLTRQMRYSTNLDEIHFNQQLVDAAIAAVDGDHETAREKLTACFDMLSEERDHYYAVDAYVLDLTLLAETTLGNSLLQQLDSKVPVNCLMPTDLLDQLNTVAPQALRSIQRGVDEGYIGLVGGLGNSSRPLMEPAESVRQHFVQGIAQFEHVLGKRPYVFGTRRFGFSPILPQLLRQLGFSGAFHFSLSDGRVPDGSQKKVRWEGLDHSSLDAVAKSPLDASDAGSFLGLASRLGETMDMDHVATLCLAHWPGHVSPWYHDLRRAAKYGAMLGRFITVDEYFRETDYPGQLDQFSADQYQSPYLEEAVANRADNPISTSVERWRRRSIQDAAGTLESVSATIGGSATVELAESDECDREQTGQMEAGEDRLRVAAEQLAKTLSGPSDTQQHGYLVLNPTCSPRRVQLDLPKLERLPAVAAPVFSAALDETHKFVSVDVPAFGYAYIGDGPESDPTAVKPAGDTWFARVKERLGKGGEERSSGSRAPRSRRVPKILAEENRLFNDFFDVQIDPRTGTLQSLYQYNKRGNSLSQQLAARNVFLEGQLVGGRASTYSTMVADHIEVTAATTAFGEITTKGQLLNDQSQPLARFCQRYQVWRGSRILRLLIKLDPLVSPGEDAWDSYFGCRFAWASESSLLWRGVNQMRERGETKRMEAPSYIEIDDAGKVTTLLTGGLPFHRRTGRRMLDSLLIVRGEQAREFEFGIGVGLKYPVHEANSFISPTPTLWRNTGPPQGNTSGWFFHIACRNVFATQWSPLEVNGNVVGVRVRLMETLGRPAKGKLRGFRPFGSARRVDFSGENLGSCSVEDGCVNLELGANEWVEVEASWNVPTEDA